MGDVLNLKEKKKLFQLVFIFLHLVNSELSEISTTTVQLQYTGQSIREWTK